MSNCLIVCHMSIKREYYIGYCLGCAVLPCLVVCLTLLASFFLPSQLTLPCIYSKTSKIDFGIFLGYIADSNNCSQLQLIPGWKGSRDLAWGFGTRRYCA